MKLQLEGKTALITGASTGIGRGIAEVLAAEGARIAIAGRRAQPIEQVATAIAGTGAARPVVIVANLMQPAEVASAAARALAELGGCVDILVNNAGASRPLTDPADDAAWEEALTLNFAGARRLTHALVPAMREARWGRIINLTGALVAASPNASGAAKAALNSWSRSLAIQLAPFAITVNAIAPGRINSEQIRTRLHPTEESRDAFIQQYIPAGRFGEPEDIANLVAFLSSPLASYINGAAIPVDGAMIRVT